MKRFAVAVMFAVCARACQQMAAQQTAAEPAANEPAQGDD
jgi:hypothetical protein